MIPIPRDFREFIGLLNEKRVRYLVVGGYAVAYHGYPRTTGDIDIFIDLPDLVRNKRASGRDKDKLDLKHLPHRPRL